eukprot:CAMPEP_0175360564 /NCGR_PEP_ID=MMETSP0095-20121207/16102_1 /TAXON_ID=311494 /ORGANISM="Alexandrium monilatum, Strain CCMP3105" /LENGTH=147 /DNA_ID=CAMNT_0016658375 /DNA_START=12 /DNA_END=456 /DNA_ORIENTATION=-
MTALLVYADEAVPPPGAPTGMPRLGSGDRQQLLRLLFLRQALVPAAVQTALALYVLRALAAGAAAALVDALREARLLLSAHGEGLRHADPSSRGRRTEEQQRGAPLEPRPCHGEGALRREGQEGEDGQSAQQRGDQRGAAASPGLHV